MPSPRMVLVWPQIPRILKEAVTLPVFLPGILDGRLSSVSAGAVVVGRVAPGFWVGMVDGWVELFG